MLGKTHILSGAAAYNALTLLPVGVHPGLADRAGCTIIAAGAAALCDLDSCTSTAARTFGFVSRVVSWCIRAASGGHREGTHSGVGLLAFAAYTTVATILVVVPTVPAVYWTAAVALAGLLAFAIADGLDGLGIARKHNADLIGLAAAAGIVFGHAYVPGMAGIPVAVTVGVTAHVLGDMLTDHGCPLAWPWSERCYHLTPKWARITTGKWPEHVIAVGLAAANIWLAADTTGLVASITTTRHL